MLLQDGIPNIESVNYRMSARKSISLPAILINGSVLIGLFNDFSPDVQLCGYC